MPFLAAGAAWWCCGFATIGSCAICDCAYCVRKAPSTALASGRAMGALCGVAGLACEEEDAAGEGEEAEAEAIAEAALEAAAPPCLGCTCGCERHMDIDVRWGEDHALGVPGSLKDHTHCHV